MNKYYVKIPYSYLRYGTLTAYIYSDTEDDAMDLATEPENRYSEDFDDGDDSGDTEYDWSNMDVELEEENVSAPHDNNNQSNNTPFSNVPEYFLAELSQL